VRDLYIIQSGETGAIKIGRTSDIETRISSLQTGCPYPLRLILLVEGYGHIERELHHKLRSYRTQGEWFHLEGISELPTWIYELLNLDLLENWWKLSASKNIYCHSKSQNTNGNDHDD
jgi:hypothetical protein